MTQISDLEAQQNPLCKKMNWHSMKFKAPLQDTYLAGVKLKISSRYMGGRTRQTPTFTVEQRLSKEASVITAPKYISIPIPSLGWRKAWKQALLAMSAQNGRRHVVRHLNKPPRLEDFTSE